MRKRFEEKKQVSDKLGMSPTVRVIRFNGLPGLYVLETAHVHLEVLEPLPLRSHLHSHLLLQVREKVVRGKVKTGLRQFYEN